MYLIPSPRQCTYQEGVFKLNRKTQIVLTNRCSFQDLQAAINLQEAVERIMGIKLTITKKLASHLKENMISLEVGNHEREGYSLTITPSEIKIIGGSRDRKSVV